MDKVRKVQKQSAQMYQYEQMLLQCIEQNKRAKQYRAFDEEVKREVLGPQQAKLNALIHTVRDMVSPGVPVPTTINDARDLLMANTKETLEGAFQPMTMTKLEKLLELVEGAKE